MTANEISGVVIAIFAGGGITAVVGWISNRKKIGADAVKIYTDTTLLLLEPMRAEIKRLEERVHTASDQLTIASSLLRKHSIDWPPGSTPPPWA